MSIQQAVNQGIQLGTLLYTQTPQYEAKKEHEALKREVDREENALEAHKAGVKELREQTESTITPYNRKIHNNLPKEEAYGIIKQNVKARSQLKELDKYEKDTIDKQEAGLLQKKVQLDPSAENIRHLLAKQYTPRSMSAQVKSLQRVFDEQKARVKQRMLLRNAREQAEREARRKSILLTAQGQPYMKSDEEIIDSEKRVD